MKPRMALIGAGRMGSALLRGWAKSKHLGPDGSLLVVDLHISEEIEQLVKQHHGRTASTTNEDQLTKLETVILAVKPQKFDEVAQLLAAQLPENVLILSVIAGISLERLQAAFGPGRHVRIMPNTAAEVGKAITVLCPNEQVDTAGLRKANQLMHAVGKVETVDDEKLMDVVTAVSGSGPAYFFLLAEAMAAAGQTEGLSEQLAKKLAEQTLVGSAALLDRSDLGPAALRAEVTSPGGTTAAALDVMMGNGAFAEMLRNAISAASRRSTQLRNAG